MFTSFGINASTSFSFRMDRHYLVAIPGQSSLARQFTGYNVWSLILPGDKREWLGSMFEN